MSEWLLRSTSVNVSGLRHTLTRSIVSVKWHAPFSFYVPCNFLMELRSCRRQPGRKLRSVPACRSPRPPRAVGSPIPGMMM